MRHFARTFALLIATAHTPAALAQDDYKVASGHWVRQGTYALSGFAVNSEREHTYRGAAKEQGRVFSYLPAMTIVFPDFEGLTKGAPLLDGYVRGITQTGTPVIVLKRELSQAKFGANDDQDVVIHTAHDACPEAYCDLTTDGRPVGVGHSYKIVEGTAQDLVHLSNRSSEADFYYRLDQFNQLERSGTLTQLKGRIIPRWDIREGYAKELSLGCGGEHPKGTTFKVDSAAYEMDPSTWELNAPQWTVKAADLFVGSHLEKIGGTYTVETTQSIRDLSKPGTDSNNYKSAIDFTVFAYRDRNNATNKDYQFAVLLSLVACKSHVFGEFKPDYVRQAYLFFENDSYNLPQQISDEGKNFLSDQLDRSFMYSINTFDQYKVLFNRLAAGLGAEYSDVRSNLVAVVIARLNATCEGARRVTCAQIVNNNIALPTN